MKLTIPDLPKIERDDVTGNWLVTTSTGAFLIGDVPDPQVPSVTGRHHSSYLRAREAAWVWWQRQVELAAGNAFADAYKIDGLFTYEQRIQFLAQQKD